MPDGFTGGFTINVQGATNPTLGVGGQGVCGVTMSFDHQYLGDLRITLTSPSGQTITLVGPIGFFGETDFTSWDVTFVPCGDATAPDPGFAATWNNNQPWGLLGTYTGTYYPNNGCLQSFTGPVNGTWTLTVTDGQAIDVGNFYDYEIIFCDPSGINCFSCEANAGTLNQPDLTRCEGSSNLNLTLPPTYTAPNVAPPGATYDYAYVIAGAGGVIEAIQPTPDLTAYPPGTYTVCGLSYLTAQGGSLPVPDGSLTVAQLTASLNSGTAPFCGDVTANCVNVTITPAPPDEVVDATICAPQCYNFYNQNYCTSGTYVRTITQGACTYMATLNLVVNPRPVTNRVEIICEGTCAQTPGFEAACSAGLFTETFQTTEGCDSIVNLQVQIMALQANILDHPDLNCGQASIQLSGNGSTTGSGVTYLWTASNGGVVSGNPNLINANAAAAGDYQLRVCRTNGSVTCCDSATTTVNLVQIQPAAPAAINGNATPCQGQTFTLSAAPVPGITTYIWTLPSGVVINGNQTGANINVTWNTPNSGQVCVASTNSCGTSAPTCFDINVVPAPVATQPQGPTTACAGTQQSYSIPLVDNATSYTWSVTGAGGSIISGQGTNEITVNWVTGGNGSVCVRAVGPCGTSPQICLPVQITPLVTTPTVTGNNNVCAGSTVTYSLTSIPSATNYNWGVTNGTITGGNGTTSVQVTWNANATTGSICANAQNACSTSNDNCLNVTLGTPPAQPNITGIDMLCSGTSGSYSIASVSGASGYTWTVPTGGTITSGQNTTGISVAWASGSGGNVCVTANSGCGAGPQDCFPVSVSAQPIANAGAGGAVCGTSFNLQANPSVTGSTGAWTTVSGPGTASFTNANSAATTASVTQNGSYTFRWTESNSTCTSSATVTVNFNASPTSGQITSLCNGTNTAYTISFPVTGGTAPYTIPGGSVSGGIFTSNSINSSQPYNFTIADANGCTAAAVTGTVNCNCSTDAGDMSLTPLSACQGNTITAQHQGGQNLDADDVSAYILHTNASTSLGTVLAQNTSGTFSFQSGMTYGTTYYVSFVVGNNLGGSPDPADICLSVAAGQPVVFYQNPVANAGADADTCSLVLPLNGNASGNSAGTWTLIGGTGLSIGNAQNPSTTATATTSGNYLLVWTLNNNGCTDADTVALAFNPAPIAGTAAIDCDGANENYTVTIPLSGGTAPYSVNGTAVAGNSFVSDSVVSGQPYTFLVADANGCVSAPVTGSFLCNCATDAGSMAVQPLSTCEGGSISAQHLGGQNLDANDVTAYVLHTGSSTTLGTVIAQNATGTFNFQSGMSYGTTYYVSFVVGNNLNGAPNPSDPCLSVAPGQPVIFYQNPIANAGIDLDTCGTTLLLNGSNVGTGQWAVTSTPNGATLVLGNPSSPTSSASASMSGTYTLSWTVNQNGCVGNDQIDLEFNSAPTLSDLQRACDPANENFTVTLTLAGGTAPYTVNGLAVADSIFTSPPFPNGQGYAFNVTDANGCTMPAVMGAFACDCATDAGTMSVQTQTVCQGLNISAQANADQTLDGNDVISFVLHSGTGQALGTVFAQNATGTFSFQNGMTYGTTYYISRVAGNPLAGVPNPLDPCFSVATGQPVVWLQNPVADAGANDEICGENIDLQAVGNGFAGTWSLVSGTGSATFDDANDPASGVSVTDNGSYIFRWTEANGACTDADEVTVDFNQIPAVNGVSELCNGTNTQFTVSFDITGGTAPYTVAGLAGSYNSGIYTSNLIANNSTYTFTVTDANGCVAPSVSGVENCNCTTDAGSMQTSLTTFCADIPAAAVWNNDATTDADDIVRFVLHNGSGSTLGSTIYAVGTQPTFPFGGNLQFGVTYYISAVAGNNVAGVIDPLDPCLSVAPGTPVRWKPIPTAALSGDATLCAGDGAVLSFSGTGTYPLTLIYNDGSNDNTLIVTGSQTVTLSIVPAATTTFTLTNVADGTSPSCSAALNDPVTLTVNQPVSAGTPNEAVEFCADEAVTVQLVNLLNNADFGGQWTNVSGQPLPSGVFNAATGTFLAAGQAAGTYTFRYAVTAQAPCVSDEAIVTVIIHPEPVADAGEDKALNCNQLTVTLGGGGSTIGSYKWLLANDSIASTEQLLAANPGDYTLVVTNTAGCTDSDVVTVVLDNEVPRAERLTARNIRCFGEGNGFISVDSVSSTHPPVLFSLNGGPFTANPIFANLAPGEYTVALLDANGCESETAPLTIVEPVQLLADLGGEIQVELGDSARLELQTTLPFAALDTIVWEPLLDSTAAGLPVQRLRPFESWQVKVTVIDSNGCVARDQTLLRVDKPRNVFIPNIFNPNSPEIPTLYIFGGRDVEEIESFQIYDRWGEHVFQARNFQPNDPAYGWSGTLDGQPLNPAVFVYQAVVRFIDGERILFKGDVTLMR
jgi:hypothetical protein